MQVDVKMFKYTKKLTMLLRVIPMTRKVVEKGL